MKSQEIQITRFKSLRSTKPQAVTNLAEVLEEIASEKYKDKILEIRKFETPAKSPLKDLLPVFTPTGKFNHRSIAGLEQYNGVICLDIDGIEKPEEIKEIAKNIPWVTAAFITPSGKGLKVIVQTSGLFEDYKDIEIAVSTEFENLTGVCRDKHCKDIARIQFVSYDPMIYINENPEYFCYLKNRA
jgi:hypothetical protein